MMWLCVTHPQWEYMCSWSLIGYTMYAQHNLTEHMQHSEHRGTPSTATAFNAGRPPIHVIAGGHINSTIHVIANGGVNSTMLELGEGMRHNAILKKQHVMSLVERTRDDRVDQG
eukprot:359258-Chlamydomonas_euryale.AAC.20